MEKKVSNNTARKAWNFLRRSGHPLFGQAKDGRSGIVHFRGTEVQFESQRFSVRELPAHVREILRNSRERFLRYWG